VNILDAFILGLVQGLAEFIPVSSSGHLILFNELFNLHSSFHFDLILNIGTLLAGFLYFRHDIYEIITKYKTNSMYKLLMIATIPAVLFGAIFKATLSGDGVRSVAVVTTMLLIIGVLFIAESALQNGSKKINSLNSSGALGIGFAQALALIPGTSRSGSTILAGRFLGLSREDAARFSFLLSLPIIGGAVLFSLLTDPINLQSIGTSNIAIGILTSFTSSLLAIHFMLRFLKKHGLRVFGIYRVVLAGVLLFVL